MEVLGWAGKNLNRKFSTPIFDGATLDEINKLTDEAKFLGLVTPTCTMEVRVKNLINQQQWELSTC